MVRRRTAVTTAAAVALLLASPALTACGSSGPDRTGAAAVVGNERISVATLQAKVNAVRAEQAVSPQSSDLIAGSGRLSAQTLQTLVQNAVIDKAADEAGVTVSSDEVAEQRAVALQQVGGGNEQVLDAALLNKYSVGSADIDSFIRTNALVGKLIQSLGYEPGSDEAQAAVIKDLAKTADRLGVTVNPRYGAWDGKNFGLGDVHYPWLVNKTPSAVSPADAPAA